MPNSTDDLDDEDDLDTGEERDESDEETGAAEMAPASVQPPARRPRANRAPPPAAISDFGAVPASCIAWGIKRANLGGTWDPLSYGEGDVHRHTWPIAELSKENVIGRWGPGTYRTQWFKATPGGGRHYLGLGQPVTYLATAPEPTAAALPSAANPLGESFGLAMQLMQVIGREKNEAIAGLAQMAQLFAGQQKGGLGAAELQLILQNQAAANEKAIAAAVAAAVAPLQAQVAAMREDDDDDGAGQTIAAAAGVAAPFVKGKGWGATAVNFASAHPEIAETIVTKAAAVVLEGLSILKAKAQAPAPVTPPAPSAVEMRPRALHVEHQNGAHEPMGEAQSLSGWRTSPDPSPRVQ